MSDSRELLFAELRRTKIASGLSYARMEARTPYSRASLERYVNGKLWPTRQAVQAIATACDADPAPLLRLWDKATEPEPEREPRSTAAVGPPKSSVTGGTDEEPVPDTEPGVELAGSPRRVRRRWLSVVGAVVAAVVGVVAFVASSGSTQAAPPSAGCRDFYAELRVYTVGRMCWSNAESTLNGDLTNPDERATATAQVCVSNHPNRCARRLTLATAGKGQIQRYRTTVHLPPGHGTWVRVCLDTHCSEWE